MVIIRDLGTQRESILGGAGEAIRDADAGAIDPVVAQGKIGSLKEGRARTLVTHQQIHVGISVTLVEDGGRSEKMRVADRRVFGKILELAQVPGSLVGACAAGIKAIVSGKHCIVVPEAVFDSDPNVVARGAV